MRKIQSSKRELTFVLDQAIPELGTDLWNSGIIPIFIIRPPSHFISFYFCSFFLSHFFAHFSLWMVSSHTLAYLDAHHHCFSPVARRKISKSSDFSNCLFLLKAVYQPKDFLNQDFVLETGITILILRGFHNLSAVQSSYLFALASAPHTARRRWGIKLHFLSLSCCFLMLHFQQMKVSIRVPKYFHSVSYRRKTVPWLEFHIEKNVPWFEIIHPGAFF